MTGGDLKLGEILSGGWDIVAGIDCTPGTLTAGVLFVGKTLGGSVSGEMVDGGSAGIEASGRFTGGTFTTPPEFTGRLAGGKM